MQKPLLLALLFWLPFLINAQSQETPPPLKMTVEQYVEKYSSLAVDEMFRSKIPASITLAQGILESGNGNSRLATEANNHFGIKCKSTWTGKTLFEDDDAPQECFRKYDAAIDSYRDHSDFLMKNVRYAFLFDLAPTDYVAWAHGLKKAGYATNPQYAELLITFIEKHKLHRFDGAIISDEESKELKEDKAETMKSHGTEFINNGVPGIIARPDESYVQLANNYGLKVFQLYRNNDLTKDAVCKVGDTIYLKPKKNKSDILVHRVQPNQTMYWISQRYAVKLEKLLDRNQMRLGQEPAAGELIYLHNKSKKQPLLADTTGYKTEIISVGADSLKMDTIYNQKVYEDPLLNLETSKPAEPSILTDSTHEFKQCLSFFHTVQKGETLYGIGKRYGIRVDAIQFINALNSDSIGIGQRLIINPAILSADTKEPQAIPGLHKVKQGETLYSISKMYNLKVADIKATNNLSSDTIMLGQQLVIVPPEPGKEVLKSKDESAEESYFHSVEKGENIYLLARKYGVTVKQIRELNPSISDVLAIGQKIRIR
ncbi:MAG: LysM peptidoglycan-binding domain-containing protein [Bacteroidota bacterium]|nr:LysM peptidoglycan-binding domain-containing protein [Bacteroidota bacterium]